MIRTLSIDGGGIRGQIVCQILIAIEERLGDRIANHIDFCAGTSTGGLITAMLLHPKNYTAKEISGMFEEYGSEIFPTNPLRAALSYVHGSKYPSEGFESVLRRFIGLTRLSELTKPAIITAYDLINRNVKIFAQSDFEKYGLSGDYYLKDVCRSTSSAPTYFPPHTFKSLSGTEYTCADGGLAVNNPSLAAHSEILNSKGNPTTKDIFMVSLGTGMSLKPVYGKGLGDIGWISPVIDILMSASSEVVDFHLTQLFKAAKATQQYVRIEPKDIFKASWEMDCTTPSNNKSLIEAGKKIASQKRKTLDKIAMVLSQQKSLT